MGSKKFVLKIEGKNEKGEKISPANFDIIEVQNILEIANKMITGSANKTERGTIGLEYKDGSAFFNFIASASIVLGLNADLEKIEKNHSLKDISPIRASCVHELQKKASKNNWKIELSGKNDERNIKVEIDASTTFLKEENEWFEVEKVLYGELTDIGGSSSSNLHVKLDEGKTITIPASKGETENVNEIVKVYQPIGVLISALENVHDGSLDKESIKFLTRIPYKPDLSDEELANSIEIGTSVWGKIKDAGKWIRDKRNNNN